MKVSIQDFKSALKTGGLRPTMFEVFLTLPERANWYQGSFQGLQRDLILLCKSAQIPSSMLTTMTIGLPAGGALKLPASRIFEPWTIRVINDGEMRIRTMFEEWQRAIMGRGVQLSTSPRLSTQFGTAEVYQLDREGNPVKGYRLEGLYPEMTAAQELNSETQNTITEFECVLQYQYWNELIFENITIEERLGTLRERGMTIEGAINIGSLNIGGSFTL